MKILVKTEGLPGAEKLTEIERDDAPDELIILDKVRDKKHKFQKTGIADGMPYYRRVEDNSNF